MVFNNSSKFNLLDYNVVVKVNIPSQEAKLSGILGQTLGQYRIKVKSFCDEFNKFSQKFSKELPLRTTILIKKDLTFDFFCNVPELGFFLKTYKTELSLLTLYKISKIKQLDNPDSNLKRIYKCILSSLTSYNN